MDPIVSEKPSGEPCKAQVARVQESGSSVETPQAQSTLGFSGESALEVFLGMGELPESKISKTNLVTSSTKETSMGEARWPSNRSLTKR